jgi:hypothetical protein
MKVSFASSILLAAGLVAAVSARADAQSMTLGATPAASATSSSPNLSDLNSPNGPSLGTRTTHSRFVWGGVGIEGAEGSALFGINVGASVDLISVAPDLPLSIFANAGLGFSSFLALPLTVGAAVHYDKLPVGLFGGAGLTVVPNTVSGAGIPVGVGLFTMVSYPLPQVYRGLSAMGQFQFHILTESATLTVFDVGAMLDF